MHRAFFISILRVFSVLAFLAAATQAGATPCAF
jgi:hypothetical protein